MFNFFVIFAVNKKVNIMIYESYSDRKKLFNYVDALGEMVIGDLHIEDNTDMEEKVFPEDKKYRVYHADGFIFDIERIRNFDVEIHNTSEFLEPEYEYNYMDDFDGVPLLPIEDAVQMVKQYL